MASSPSTFHSYLMTFGDTSVEVNNAKSEDAFVGYLEIIINKKHRAFKVTIQPDLPRVWELMQQHFDFAEDLARYGKERFLSPKKVSEVRENNKIVATYASGVIEDFTELTREFKGTRTFPDGTKEIGSFNVLPRNMYAGRIIKRGGASLCKPTTAGRQGEGNPWLCQYQIQDPKCSDTTRKTGKRLLVAFIPHAARGTLSHGM